MSPSNEVQSYNYINKSNEHTVYSKILVRVKDNYMISINIVRQNRHYLMITNDQATPILIHHTCIRYIKQLEGRTVFSTIRYHTQNPTITTRGS